MKPITTQAELDAVLSDRLKRERAKLCKSYANDLQGVINELIEIQNRLSRLEAKNRQTDSE